MQTRRLQQAIIARMCFLLKRFDFYASVFKRFTRLKYVCRASTKQTILHLIRPIIKTSLGNLDDSDKIRWMLRLILVLVWRTVGFPMVSYQWTDNLG